MLETSKIITKYSYPFGMVMPGRQFQSGNGYRYGFNGMEKDDEIKGSGNSLDFGARLYDPRLARWMSLDPLKTKFPSMTPYLAFGGNPVLLVDPDGRDLFVSGKVDIALDDIKSLVPEEFQSLIKISDDGQIQFDVQNLSAEVMNYEGVSLLNNLVNSDKKYNYKVGDELIGIDRESNVTYNNLVANEGPLKENPIAKGAILNFSITKRSDVPLNSVENSMPQEGFDGSVLIQDGEFTRINRFTREGDYPVKRNTVVFHELYENYLRTEEGLDYSGKNGAHQESLNSGSKFSKEVNNEADMGAGTATGFKKAN